MRGQAAPEHSFEEALLLCSRVRRVAVAHRGTLGLEQRSHGGLQLAVVLPGCGELLKRFFSVDLEIEPVRERGCLLLTCIQLSFERGDMPCSMLRFLTELRGFFLELLNSMPRLTQKMGPVADVHLRYTEDPPEVIDSISHARDLALVLARVRFGSRPPRPPMCVQCLLFHGCNQVPVPCRGGGGVKCTLLYPWPLTNHLNHLTPGRRGQCMRRRRGAGKLRTCIRTWP